jgi:signal transduction histidine kinase/CheY-like chemotaxis protein
MARKYLLEDTVLRAAAAFLVVFFALFFVPGIPPQHLIVIGDYIIDPVLLGVVASCYLQARRQTQHVEERRFWDFMALGFVLHLSVLALNLGWNSPGHTAATWILSDTFFLLFYLALFLAVETRPHRASGWSHSNRALRLDSLGAVVFVFVLLVYVILVPSRFNADEYESSLPALAMFVTLDLVLVGRALFFRRTARTLRWQRLYGMLALGALCTAFNDGRELVDFAMGWGVPRGNLWDWLWYPQAIIFIALGRAAVLLPANEVQPPPRNDAAVRPAVAPACTLMVYGFLLPVLHFLWHQMHLVDPSMRSIRDLVVLTGLFILALMAVMQYVVLSRQHRALQTQLTQAQENLHQSRRMEAVGRLAGGVAHDFNNLLMVIRGYAEILEEHITAESPRRSLRNILAAADRATSLTGQLLAFSRKRVVTPCPQDLAAVMHSIEGFLHRLLGRHIHLEISAPRDLWPVRADRGQLDQILMNLSANARDAMPNGGTLTISAANAEVDLVTAARLGLPGPGRFVRLDVRDTGLGMDEETRHRIFEPFFTTKDVGKGTGLGLATVYAIVRQYEGAIAVASAPVAGTTFSLYFPKTTGSASPDAPQLDEEQAHGSETILLVEDEQEIRSVTREFLEDSGYTVIEASSPQEALDAFAEGKGDFPLLVTDVIMPGMNGREMAERLQSARPGLKVLFVSGHTDDQAMLEGVADQNLEFLQKPYSRGALIHRVRQMLNDN